MSTTRNVKLRKASVKKYSPKLLIYNNFILCIGIFYSYYKFEYNLSLMKTNGFTEETENTIGL